MHDWRPRGEFSRLLADLIELVRVAEPREAARRTVGRCPPVPPSYVSLILLTDEANPAGNRSPLAVRSVVGEQQKLP